MSLKTFEHRDWQVIASVYETWFIGNSTAEIKQAIEKLIAKESEAPMGFRILGVVPEHAKTLVSITWLENRCYVETQCDPQDCDECDDAGNTDGHAKHIWTTDFDLVTHSVNDVFVQNYDRIQGVNHSVTLD
jgi:hypothetical protein